VQTPPWAQVTTAAAGVGKIPTATACKMIASRVKGATKFFLNFILALLIPLVSIRKVKIL
jgi:hypothetical protein